jgi:hypothetical protein
VTIFVTPLSDSGDIGATEKATPGYQNVPGVGDSACLTDQDGAVDPTFVKASTLVHIVTSGVAIQPVINLARAAAARL